METTMNTKNTSTKDTCPRLIWVHEVIMGAIAKGAKGPACQEPEVMGFVVRWYNAGEPVWMAADSLAFLVKRREIEARARKESDALSSVVMAALRAGGNNE